MIVKKIYKIDVKYKAISGIKYTYRKEGWYLLGFIPIYVRDLDPRETFR